eukprot:2627057-Pyramimonas_sp.AAC.1
MVLGGEVQNCARYLGPRILLSGVADPEVVERGRAASAGFYSLTVEVGESDPSRAGPDRIAQWSRGDDDHFSVVSGVRFSPRAPMSRSAPGSWHFAGGGSCKDVAQCGGAGLLEACA